MARHRDQHAWLINGRVVNCLDMPSKRFSWLGLHITTRLLMEILSFWWRHGNMNAPGNPSVSFSQALQLPRQFTVYCIGILLAFKLLVLMNAFCQALAEPGVSGSS